MLIILPKDLYPQPGAYVSNIYRLLLHDFTNIIEILSDPWQK